MNSHNRRLDKIEESLSSEEQQANEQKLVIYDADSEEEPERPKNTSGVVFFIPDNGRD